MAFFATNDSHILNSSMAIGDVLSLMPLAPQPVVNYEDFTHTQQTLHPQTITSPRMPIPVDPNSQQAVSQPTLPSQFALPPVMEVSTGLRSKEAVARRVGEQSVLSAASAVMKIAATTADAPEAQTFFHQQDVIRTILEAGYKPALEKHGIGKGSTNKKRDAGNAGFFCERIDGRNKIMGSQRKEVDNLEAGSYGQRVLSKLATELSGCCNGTFEWDKFNTNSSLNFQKFLLSSTPYNNAAKSSGEWGKLVKFCMMVDKHGDKDCSGAPSKALRSFPLIFNGIFINGEQKVVSPFTTIEELQSHDLDIDNDRIYETFIKEMAVELAKGVKGSSDIHKKIKNIEKDMKKCVRDIKQYTKMNTVTEMWNKWVSSSNTINSEEQRKEDEIVPDNTVVNSDATDAEEADDAEEEYDEPKDLNESAAGFLIDPDW